MTQEQFIGFVDELKEKGWTDERILYVFCRMFQDRKIGRDALVAVADVLGFEMSPKMQAMDDEELRENVLNMDPSALEQD